MPRILVPVDGSDGSLRAVKHVARLKDRLREKLEVLLLNVQPPVSMGDLLLDGRLSQVHRLEAPIRKEGAARLAAAEAELEAAGVESDSHVEVGEPGAVIAGMAEKYHCDMIVMGERGLGAVAGLCLGSVATRVVHLSTMPVMVVP